MSFHKHEEALRDLRKLRKLADSSVLHVGVKRELHAIATRMEERMAGERQAFAAARRRAEERNRLQAEMRTFKPAAPEPEPRTELDDLADSIDIDIDFDVEELVAIETTRDRPIYMIAREIVRLWANPNQWATEYLDAMMELGTVKDRFGVSDGDSVVRGFLANCQGFTGEDAARLKKELRGKLPKGEPKRKVRRGVGSY